MSLNAFAAIVWVLVGLVIALGVALYFVWRELRSMRIRDGAARAVADALRDGRDEEAVRELLSYLESAHGRLEALSQHARALDQAIERINERSQIFLQRVGILRFDAADDVSGKLSCALCVIDAHNNGFLIPTLSALDRSRAFVRSVREGKTDRELLPEEGEALKSAIAQPVVRAARHARPAPEPARAQPPEPEPAAVEAAADAADGADDA